MRAFRFAIQSMALGERQTLLTDARATVEHGYEEFYAADHIGSVDPFVSLMPAAELDPKLRVGTLVLNNEFHHPVLLARTVATADRLTKGRFVLGLGTGYMQSEHDASGIELRPPGRRVDRFAESLIVLRSLLDTGAATFAGDHHHVDIDDLGVRPTQERVPFLIGGHGRRVVSLAGRHADIFQFTGLTHGEGGKPAPGGFDIADIRERNRWLEEAAGGRLGDIERSILVQATGVRDDVAEEIDQLAARFGADRELVERTPFVLLGTVEQIVDKLERLRDDIGVSHVVVRDAEGFAPVVEALAGR